MFINLIVVLISLCMKVKVKVLVTRSCLTLCNPMDCSPPGSSVHGISQARILAWGAIPFSTGSSQPRDRTWLFLLAGRFFTVRATSEALTPCVYVSNHHLCTFSSVQFSYSVMSDSLRPHESQHARPPCPSPTPGVYSNSSLKICN